MTAEQCSVHGASGTPHIDSHLSQPSTKAALLALSKALADAANEEHCTKCATETATKALTEFIKESHDAKKSGQWSKQDQKAFKQEAKGLFKGMKGDAKSIWKAKQVGVAAG
jgi:hypothetical protein